MYANLSHFLQGFISHMVQKFFTFLLSQSAGRSFRERGYQDRSTTWQANVDLHGHRMHEWKPTRLLSCKSKWWENTWMSLSLLLLISANMCCCFSRCFPDVNFPVSYEGFLEIFEPNANETVGNQSAKFQCGRSNGPICISPSASATSACRQGFALRAEEFSDTHRV